MVRTRLRLWATVPVFNAALSALLQAAAPSEPELRWRGPQLLAHTATGTIAALASVPVG